VAEHLDGGVYVHEGLVRWLHGAVRVALDTPGHEPSVPGEREALEALDRDIRERGALTRK
jgi:hypothetical protein